MSAATLPHILVIDDDPDMRDLVVEYLGRNEMRVSARATGREMYEVLDHEAIDLVLLDLKLQAEDGMRLAQDLRQRATVPIVLLTGRNEEADRVMGLELGADDYVTKPFSPRELLARVRAAVRRLNQSSDKIESFSFDDVEVNFSKMELHRAGVLVALTPQEFKMLRFFLNNQERVISRTELLNEVWGYNNYPTTRTVDTHILRLRQKLEKDPTDPVHFRTVHGTGYKFVR